MNENAQNFPPEKEKRKKPRISGSVIEYSFADDVDNRITAFMKDVSMGGTCIYVHEDIQEGSELQLFLHLFGCEQPLETKGKVVWKKSSKFLHCFDIGIMFIEMDEENSNRLEQYIANFDDQEIVKSQDEITEPDGERLKLQEKQDQISEDGILKRYYDTGQLLSEVNIVNGKMDGLQRFYFRSGEILEEISWVDGQREGPRRCYYTNGVLRIEQEFQGGQSVSIKKYDQKGKPFA